MRLGGAGRRFHPGTVGLAFAVGDVVGDRTVGQEGFLGDVAHRPAQ